MTESAKNSENPARRKERIKQEKIALVKELFESQENFPFPGIDPESLLKLRAADEEDPGYTTPIDQILERFQNEGMKIVLGKHPESGNIYALPFQSNDIGNDSISPRYLLIDGVTDERLKKLISLSRG